MSCHHPEVRCVACDELQQDMIGRALAAESSLASARSEIESLKVRVDHNADGAAVLRKELEAAINYGEDRRKDALTNFNLSVELEAARKELAEARAARDARDVVGLNQQIAALQAEVERLKGKYAEQLADFFKGICGNCAAIQAQWDGAHERYQTHVAALQARIGELENPVPCPHQAGVTHRASRCVFCENEAMAPVVEALKKALEEIAKDAPELPPADHGGFIYQRGYNNGRKTALYFTAKTAAAALATLREAGGRP